MANQFDVNGLQIHYQSINETDYLSLTDLAKFKTQTPDKVIEHWMRNRSTFDYLAVWETLYNPNFDNSKLNELRMDSSTNTFMLSPQRWVAETKAIGIYSKIGRNGGTFAHKDIAFKFASWLSVEFELYVIKEFQRLKQEEQKQLAWTAKRELTRINYRIHTDAIKENLIVPTLTQRQINFVYANEADILNVALFGNTATEWRTKNSDKKGNIRDSATLQQLLVLANMESHNAEMISEGLSQKERLVKLNQMAKRQLKILLETNNQLLFEDETDKK